MNKLTPRLAAAALATTVTWTLFAGVVSIAEPQRGVLLARLQPAPAASAVADAAAPMRVAAATPKARR